MMVREFLEQLSAAGVTVSVQGGALHCSAPKGALTTVLEAELKDRKAEVLAFLRAGVATDSSVVPIQPKGSRLPFFGVPGHNGDVFCYVALAQRMGEDQPFYGLQPRGFNGECPPLENLAALAEHYVRQLIDFFPSGPYLLGGYCAGGSLAFEVAQQLMARGAEVRLLALFATPFPTVYQRPHRLVANAQYVVDRLLHHLHGFLSPGPVARSRYLRDRMDSISKARSVHRNPAAKSEDNLVKREIANATIKAVKAYRPAMFSGRIHLFMPSQKTLRQDYGRARNWLSYARLGGRLHIGPDGCAGDTILREPFVEATANLLIAAIDQERTTAFTQVLGAGCRTLE